MCQRVLTTARYRYGAALLSLGLAIVLAACGAATGGGPTPTATRAPTATPTPACTSWQIVPSPLATTPRYANSALTAVSALSPTDVWAVGGTYVGGEHGYNVTAPLIEEWNGSAWSIVASPGVTFLSGVAAVAANDVWAVGGSVSRVPGTPVTFPHAIAEHWNGTAWSSAPTTALSGDTLRGIVAVASNQVWAVGEYSPSSSLVAPLIERWDGTAWQVVASPVPSGMAQSSLDAVTAIPGTNQLWAVGNQKKTVSVGAYTQLQSGQTYTPSQSADDFQHSLIEQWDGSAWHVVPGPTLPSSVMSSTLTGAVALSATDAWAVGNYGDRTGIHSLIAHWDGTSWKTVASPDEQAYMGNVAAVGPNDVRAVSSNAAQTPISGIVEQWDGTQWSVVQLPKPQGATDSTSIAITTDGAGGYWAVGYYYTSAYHPLVERCS